MGLISTKKAAEMVGMSPSYIRDHRDEITYYRLGNRIRINEDDLLVWSEKQKQEPKVTIPTYIKKTRYRQAEQHEVQL